jgi:hypothetical protein
MRRTVAEYQVGSGAWRIGNQYSASIAHYRHKAKLADGIPDGTVSIGFLKLYLRQWVKKPGDY